MSLTTSGLTPEQEEAGGRVLLVNDGAYDATRNRYGLGRGGNSRGVFVGALRDFILFARGAIDFVSLRVGEVRALALRFEAAVAAIQTGPVTSVNGQVGAVTVDTSILEVAVNDKLDEVDTALAGITAAQEALVLDAAAYALAYGD